MNGTPKAQRASTHTHTHTRRERERERPLEDVQMFEDYGKEYMAYW